MVCQARGNDKSDAIRAIARLRPSQPSQDPRKFDASSPANSSQAGQPINADNLIFSADTLSLDQVEEYRRIILSSLPTKETFDRLVGIYYEQAVRCSFSTELGIYHCQGWL